MPGARCTRSLAWESKKPHELVTTVTPERSGIPRAMVLTVSFEVSPESRLVASVACGNPRQLDTSVGVSGRHDFAVREPARSSAAPPASTASRPHVRDDRETPLEKGRDANRNSPASTGRSSINSENQK